MGDRVNLHSHRRADHLARRSRRRWIPRRAAAAIFAFSPSRGGRVREKSTLQLALLKRRIARLPFLRPEPAHAGPCCTGRLRPASGAGHSMARQRAWARRKTRGRSRRAVPLFRSAFRRAPVDETATARWRGRIVGTEVWTSARRWCRCARSTVHRVRCGSARGRPRRFTASYRPGGKCRDERPFAVGDFQVRCHVSCADFALGATSPGDAVRVLRVRHALPVAATAAAPVAHAYIDGRIDGASRAHRHSA